MRAASTSLLNTIGPASPVRCELRGEISSKQPSWLTLAIATSVHAVRGTVKRIALALGVPEHTVYLVADANVPQALKAWWIPVIVRETGSLAVLHAIARECNCVVVQLPPATVGEHAALVARAGKAMLETGDVIHEVGQSLADQKVTPEERRRIDHQIEEAIAALVTLRLSVKEHS